MKRIALQCMIFIGLYLAVGLLRYPYVVLPEKISGYAQSLAKQQSIDLEIVNPGISFPFQIAAEGVHSRVTTPLGPLLIRTDNVRCSIAAFALLRLTLSSNCQLSAYNGSLSATAARSFFSEKLRVKSQFRQLNLEQVPLINQYSLTGLLDLQWEGDFHPSRAVADGAFTIGVREGVYTGAHKIMGLVQLPDVFDINGMLSGRITPHPISNPQVLGSKFELLEVALNSSLGTATASGSGQLNQRFQLDSFVGEVELRLSSDGVKNFGGYLALASGTFNANEVPGQTSAHWKITIDKKAQQNTPTVRAMPITE